MLLESIIDVYNKEINNRQPTLINLLKYDFDTIINNIDQNFTLTRDRYAWSIRFNNKNLPIIYDEMKIYQGQYKLICVGFLEDETIKIADTFNHEYKDSRCLIIENEFSINSNKVSSLLQDIHKLYSTRHFNDNGFLTLLKELHQYCPIYFVLTEFIYLAVNKQSKYSLKV